LVFYLKDRNGKSWWIWNTLGMSGGWRLEAGKHSHVEFRTSKGTVWFNDPRNFGTLKFVDNEAETLKKINSIGPNHLQMEISDDLFKSRLMLYPKVTLAQSLMSQSLIGGVGNYIKAEALYRAKLSPHRLVETLTDEEFSRLNAAVREVILGSFDNGGASISTYYQIDGSEGKFPFFFMVYGRNVCHNGYQVVTETTLDGRTTHWVPELQN
jgi:formamidopyrimidine-DNA glycosylase